MERSGTVPLALVLAIPVMTKERFAEMAGVEVGVVRGMLDRGHLPAIKIGRHRFVNLAALQARCLAEGGETGHGVREAPLVYARC